MNNESMYLNKPLQNDDVFPKMEVKSIKSLTKLASRQGLDNFIVVKNEIVNVVSKRYGVLANQNFFPKVDERLDQAGIEFAKRSINRGNRSFAVDYILTADKYVVDVKNKADKIVPMMRFATSYDGSAKTSGHFGFFRQVCSNGLHSCETKIGFSIRHRGNMEEVLMPKLDELIAMFYQNEFFSIKKKFEVLAESPIKDVEKFVKLTAEKLGLFKYAKSEQNPDPSKNAQLVLDTISNEAALLKVKPNLWIGYNAFNAILHDRLKKCFEDQKRRDSQLLEFVSETNYN
jgi:hypothetical protein